MDNEDLVSPEDLETDNSRNDYTKVDESKLIIFLKCLALNQEQCEIFTGFDVDVETTYQPLVYHIEDVHINKLRCNDIFNEVKTETLWSMIDKDTAIASFKNFSFKNLNLEGNYIKIPQNILKGLFISLQQNYETLKQNPDIVESYPSLFFDIKFNKNEPTQYENNYIFLIIIILTKIDILNEHSTPLYNNDKNEDINFFLKKHAFENILSSIQKFLLTIEKIAPSSSYDGLLDEVVSDFQKNIIEIRGLFEQIFSIERTRKQQNKLSELQKETNQQQEEITKLVQKTEENLKKSQEALKYSIKSAYSIEQQKLLQDKKCLRTFNYCCLFLLIISIFFINIYGFKFDLTQKISLSFPFIFLLYVVFRVIRQLDKSIEHYEHKLSTNELLRIYLEDDKDFKDKAIIEQYILNIVTLKPDGTHSNDDSLLPYIKEIKDIVKAKEI